MEASFRQHWLVLGFYDRLKLCPKVHKIFGTDASPIAVGNETGALNIPVKAQKLWLLMLKEDGDVVQVVGFYGSLFGVSIPAGGPSAQ